MIIDIWMHHGHCPEYLRYEASRARWKRIH